MCDISSILWVARNITKQEIAGKRIIEVGAYDVNGSVRPLFELLEPREYIGIDIVPGPGVDIVCQAEQLVEKFGRDSFDIVISCTTLEHIKDWRATISNMKNICAPNGLLIIIVPSVWPFHAFPHDYWRYSGEDIRQIFADCNILTLKEEQGKTSLVYAKIRKTQDFEERDLSRYPLYSVMVKKKVLDIDDSACEKFIRFYRTKNIIRRMIRKICSLLPEE